MKLAYDKLKYMGEGEENKEHKPSIEEVFGGKDVSLGKEIVEKLQAEEVGLPVYRIFPQEQKTSYLVDRKPGDDDMTVRKKTETPRTLLGIILSTNMLRSLIKSFSVLPSRQVKTAIQSAALTWPTIE